MINVRVLTWNVLAQKLSDSFPEVNPEHLQWEYRRALFKQEFFKTEADGELFWDIICLQEVDDHLDLFTGEHWRGITMSHAPDRHTNAIMFNPKKFRLID